MTPSNFKLYLFVCAALLGFQYYVTRNFLLSAFILLFSTAPFLSPGKYYSFSLIQPGEVRWEVLKDTGVLGAYGMVASDIFMVLVFYLSMQAFFSAQNSVVKGAKLQTLPLSFIIVLSSWIIFSVLLLYHSVTVSAFPTFSSVMGLQYTKILLALISVSSWLSADSRNKGHLFQIVAGFLLAANCVAFSQVFMRVQSLSTIPENISVEEANLFPRVVGIFTHANQLALVTSLLTIGFLFLIPKTAPTKYQEQLTVFVLITSFLIVLISQSRVIWLFAGLSSLRYLLAQRDVLLKKYSSTIKKYRHVLILTSFFLFFVIILPRLYYSRYSFDDGSASIRQRMIEEGVYVLQDSGYSGFGAGTNIEVMMRYFPTGYIQDFPYDIHFGYLQLALEVGVAGAFFFFFPWVFLFRLTIEQRADHTFLNENFLIQASAMAILMYHVLQPHSGRIDFFYHGALMALCLKSKDTSWNDL